MANADRTVAYRDFPKFLGFRAGDDGSVWTRWGRFRVLTETWRQLQGSINKRGYLSFDLHHDGKSFPVWGHRIILETFVGPAPPGMECRHLDGNPSNNRLSNLVWGTHSENMQDRKRHGRARIGELHLDAKLTNRDVLAIRELAAKGGVLQREIAAKFGVAEVTIGDIIRGKTWRHL